MRRYVLLGCLALAVLGADQVTKYMAVRDLTRVFARAGAETLGERVDLFYGEQHLEHLRRPPRPVIPGYWRHRYAENPGAAFNLLQDAHGTFRIIFFSLVLLFALAFIGAMIRRSPEEAVLLPLALGGVLGGALGNFADRFTRGYVIDFIEWYVEGYPRLVWPTFNVADVGITVGAALLFWQVLRDSQLEPESPNPAQPEETRQEEESQ